MLAIDGRKIIQTFQLSWERKTDWSAKRYESSFIPVRHVLKMTVRQKHPMKTDSFPYPFRRFTNPLLCFILASKHQSTNHVEDNRTEIGIGQFKFIFEARKSFKITE